MNKDWNTALGATPMRNDDVHFQQYRLRLSSGQALAWASVLTASSLVVQAWLAKITRGLHGFDPVIAVGITTVILSSLHLILAMMLASKGKLAMARECVILAGAFLIIATPMMTFILVR